MKNAKATKRANTRFTYVVCFVLMMACSLLLPILLKTNKSVQYKSLYSGFEVGEISDTNVYAKSSADLIDNAATEECIAQARDSILPIFSFSNSKTLQVISNVDSLRNAVSTGDYAKIASVVGTSLAEKVFFNGNSTVLSLTYEIVTDICSMGFFEQSEVDEVKREGYSSIVVSNHYITEKSKDYEQSISMDDLSIITSDNIVNYISSSMNSYTDKISAQDVILIEELVYAIAKPNVFYDQNLTLQRRDLAEKSIDPVVISVTKGELLIEADHVVTHEQVELLELLSTQSNSVSFLEFLGYFIFDALCIGIGLYVFGMFLGRKNIHFNQYNVLLTSGFILSAVATYFLTIVSSSLELQFSDSFLPVFFLPLFITMITGYKRLGFVSIFILGMIMATLPTARIMTFFYCVACGSACVFLIRFFNRRIDMIYQWFFSSIACAGITLLFMLIDGCSFNSVFVVVLGVVMNVSIAYILLAIAIPLVEKLFNLPTIFRLHELAYGDSAILMRLAQSAPGTYSHSRSVADLAEAGAKAIGANALLARVGGLYHDIGKIEHPEYFVENQSGVNKHDDISPSLSVAVIKSHVKVGADKGRESGLPPEVVKIIASHHGNDVIQYFYHEALKSQAASLEKKGDVVKAADYSYNADIPDFRECGIVMLADSIEAASRTVTPNAGKFAKLIDSIFMGKIERGQLDNSNLTLNDIKALSEAFVKTLVAKYHSRIEYPDDDED